jgi:acetyl-CoA carboxylase carboxyl transferase subunit alpha
MKSVKSEILSMLDELSDQKPKDLISDRRRKYLDMGSKGLAA